MFSEFSAGIREGEKMVTLSLTCVTHGWGPQFIFATSGGSLLTTRGGGVKFKLLSGGAFKDLHAQVHCGHCGLGGEVSQASTLCPGAPQPSGF